MKMWILPGSALGMGMSASVSSDQVSVVIPTYNRREEVSRAIESVLTQTVAPGEIIVVDDGSTDGTEEALENRFGARVRRIRQKNGGAAAARNTGVAAARGVWVAFLDSDDRWTPRKLELQVSALTDPRVVLSATNWIWENQPNANIFDTIGLRFDTPVFVESQPLRIVARFEGCGILIQSCICRRDALLRVGGFDVRFRIAEDTRLLHRLASEGSFAMLAEPLLQRGVSKAGVQLTNVQTDGWQREHANNVVEILLESYAHVAHGPIELQRLLRRLLCHFLIKQARHFARDRNYRMARRKSIESLGFALASKHVLLGLLGAVFPGLLATKRRSRSTPAVSVPALGAGGVPRETEPSKTAKQTATPTAS
jgi:glycosyltransferase involved in cell wall biosynthesis